MKQFVKQDNLQRISKNEGFFNPYPPSPFPRKGGEYGGWRPSALLGALPQTPHSPCGRGISYCFFPLGKCYAPLRQGRVVFSPAEKISTLCLDCVLALSALLCRSVSLIVAICRKFFSCQAVTNPLPNRLY